MRQEVLPVREHTEVRLCSAANPGPQEARQDIYRRQGPGEYVRGARHTGESDANDVGG